MAHYQEQYGQTDEYGHPIRQSVDEYVNPIHLSTGTTGGYGTAGHGTAPPQPAGTYGGAPVIGTDTVREYHGLSGKLHRYGSSSSSSSSEEDGQGGRRKKGLKEKVKEKLPGHRDRSQATPTTTPGGYSAEQHHEKKGIIDKIKEKLPGHYHDHY